MTMVMGAKWSTIDVRKGGSRQACSSQWSMPRGTSEQIMIIMIQLDFEILQSWALATGNMPKNVTGCCKFVAPKTS